MSTSIQLPRWLAPAACLALICLAGPAGAVERTLATRVAGISAFAPPPEGFDPYAATDSELADLGFPPRPERKAEPDAYAAWAAQVAPGIRRIVPELVPMDVTFGLRDAGTARLRSDESQGWSAFVFANDLPAWGKGSFREVRGGWTVPVAQFPFGYTCGAEPARAIVGPWIGIDGSNGAGGLLQAGIAAEAICEDGEASTEYYAWGEWYPAPPQRIANLVVGPGDVFASTVTATSSTSGRVYLVNLTTRVSAALKLLSPQPPGSNLVGRTAEWVVERPGTGDGTHADLVNYVQIVFTDAGAGDGRSSFVPGRRPYRGATLERVLMVDDAGAVISIPRLLGEGTIRFRNVGSSKKAAD